MIQFFHVGKRYPGGQQALRDVTFEIPRGQFVFLTGPSGAGKTTLLKLIFREEVPSTGQILVNGRNVSSIPASKIPYLRRTIGVVFQDFRLIPRKTVFENVCYLPRILGHDVKSQKRLAYQALRRVGLAHRLNAFPRELSGGEQQRVAIARALIAEPELLIADEPTGNLDPDLSWEILRLFLEINRRGTTLLIATHDRSTIQQVGRRVLTLEDGHLTGDEMLRRSQPLPGEEPRLSLGDRTGSDTAGEEGDGEPGEDWVHQQPGPGEPASSRTETSPGSLPSPGKAASPEEPTLREHPDGSEDGSRGGGP